MSFVLDASTVMSWAFGDEENDPVAQKVWSRLTEYYEEAYAPALWWMEVRNVLIVNERRKRITQTQTKAFLGALSRMHVTLDTGAEEASLLLLARQHGLTVYDAAYLELAQRLGLPIATLDNALVKAARKAGVARLQ